MPLECFSSAEIELDEKTVDALVRDILSLLQSH